MAQSRKKCICDLCSCGSHHCPHVPNKILEEIENQPCHVSEYQEKYLLHPSFKPQESFKPKLEYRKKAVPMEFLTTTRNDYEPHKALPVKVKPPDKYVPSDKTMDLTSTYQESYYSHGLCRVASMKPQGNQMFSDQKMELVPSYKDDYLPWKQPKRDMIKPDNAYHTSSAKFDYKTTTQEDFNYKGPVTTVSYKPHYVSKPSDTPLEDTTSYKMNYIVHPLEKRFVPKLEKYKPSGIPFDHLTTHKDTYQGRVAEAAKLIKPRPTVHLSDAPFAKSTEFREKYQAWPTPPLHIRPPVKYIPPVEKMALVTTTQSQFTSPKGGLSKPFRPVIPIKKSSPFESISTTKDDFKQWSIKKMEPIIPVGELTIRRGPMEDLSTTRAHYTSHPIVPIKNFKPPWSSARPQVPLATETTYVSSYTPKKLVKCLASYPEPPGYVFEETDAAGHKIYRPVSDYQLSSKCEETSRLPSTNRQDHLCQSKTPEAV
ncbi:stabilizer of axonemal microtubules 1 [Tachyglossus aculeatus]|uniref:stabilizer of axonemal microtubules 1 n=1 Tax=Tachyglossus aculeatus TaxID=9261 RepID=UPI0018F5DE57|nr:stabilizer of axonemal microtubules 1 [Tachyglossus aculeatus]